MRKSFTHGSTYAMTRCHCEVCRKASSDYYKRRRQKNPAIRERDRARYKKWKDAHPIEERREYHTRWSLSARLKQHGLTLDDYARMLAEQDGACAICRESQAECYREVLVIDHDHDTGQVRGLLCIACNLALGNCRDDPDRLIAAAMYLVKTADILASLV